MSRLFKFERWVVRLEAALLSIVLIGMLILAFLQVVLRNGFDTGIDWVDIVNRHGVLWIAFLGGAIATFKVRHLSIDIMSKFLPKSFERGAQFVIIIFSIIVSTLLVKAAIAFVKDEKAFGGTIVGDIPVWTFELIIPIGFGLILFHYGMRLLEMIVEQVTSKTGARP